MNLVIVPSNELYSHSLHERFKCAANKHRELTFAISFTPSYTSLGGHGLRIWLWHTLLHINVSKSNCWIAQSFFSILQSLTQPVNFSICLFVGAISISSFFSSETGFFFWHELFKEPFIWHDFMFFLNPSNDMRC